MTILMPLHCAKDLSGLIVLEAYQPLGCLAKTVIKGTLTQLKQLGADFDSVATVFALCAIAILKAWTRHLQA